MLAFNYTNWRKNLMADLRFYKTIKKLEKMTISIIYFQIEKSHFP